MNPCFPCFGNSKSMDSERDPLLPKHHARDERRSAEQPIKAERTVVDKVVDVLAALNAGKLPTQDQLSHFLQALLKSELLKEDTRGVISGNGPMSQEGRKALRDIRGLVEAFLQFGMEKNVDNKFQELYFEVVQTDSESAQRGINTATSAAQRALDETSECIKEPTSIQSQVAFDAATILHAIRTLCETFLKSPGFRLILSDILGIARDVLAHAAADVGRTAHQVQDAAEDVQHQVETMDDIIDRDGNISVNDAKNKGKEAADKITKTAKIAADDLKKDLGDLEELAEEETKEKILQRIKEIISRLQKDPASRSALRSVLLLARKYAEIITTAAERSEDIIIDIAAEVKEDAPKTVTINATFNALLEDTKDLLQRLAQGHSLDGVILAFGNLIRHLNTSPLIVGNEVERAAEEKTPQSSSGSEPPSPVVGQHSGLPNSGKGKGKGKKNKKARMREKKAQEKQAKLSPAISTSQSITCTREETSTPRNPENTSRSFFSRLGAYLDRSIDEPGWVMSREGANYLESIFDDGVKLFSFVGEATIEVVEGEPSTRSNPSGAPKELSAQEKSRQQIKTDLKCLIDEIQAYIAAVWNDKTTMAVLHGLDALEDDLSGFLFQGVKQRQRGLSCSVVNMGSWTSWVGWAIPRLLRMLPSNAIPIPTLEIKTGNIEAALHALFVQGLAKGKTDTVVASLIPDGVVLKEWSEVRIDMADHDPSHGAQVEFSASRGKPGVQSTSRVRMHMDGVRAKIEGMGYYFKYTGSIIGYEDEGILSVDIGMGGLHEGLSADVEIEIESDSTLFESEEQIPKIVVMDDNSETEAETVFTTTATPPVDQPPIDQLPEPLFRVVDVQVAVGEVKCRIDKSRHWILNKLFLQHLAGPMVVRMAKQALEERIHASLNVLSTGLGAILRDARERRELRREKQRSGMTLQNATGDDILVEGERSEDGLTDILLDWWGAILNTGPMLLGYNNNAESEERIDVENRTSFATTSRGIIHTSTTTTTEQPRGTPAMVYNKLTNELEEVALPAQAIDGVAPKVQEDETIVAVGGGPQLFPDKGGAYGATDHTTVRSLIEEVHDATKQAAQNAIERLGEVSEGVAHAEERWEQKLDAERQSTKTWKSKAFDFQ